ncbi:hypothetical protein NEOLEDRAFT_1139772 [Neolentinus lepideus HHB14362 ss-1]|uniref:Uncharacterized protein n=1 Tax=Neolentinus lepideus HHB14362 ss-1 TaxID=1314782 RepID=A0A165PK19_9AGAM|nr:hypothetical protein NEOLEDRAFT_1139772 [Neolentinus lepideus HHB14362 ss-1]
MSRNGVLDRTLLLVSLKGRIFPLATILTPDASSYTLIQAFYIIPDLAVLFSLSVTL